MTSETDAESTEANNPRRVSIEEYIRRRNGVALGVGGSLQRMLRRSLGARSFAVFWQYWNPIFGYALGRYVYIPLKRWMPPALALLLTFVTCGAFHDLISTVAGKSIAFLFTPWFFFLGLGVLLSRALGMNLKNAHFAMRVSVNLAYIATCLWLALLVKHGLGF